MNDLSFFDHVLYGVGNVVSVLKKNYEKFVHERQNHLKNLKLRENWTWLGKKAFHLGICDP